MLTTNPYRAAGSAGLDLIMDKETFRARAYDDRQPNRTAWHDPSDVRGVPTIGYGHTAGVTKLDVVKGRTITKDQAVALLQDDLIHVYTIIYSVVGAAAVAKLDPCQYDALVSFVYNCGLKPEWTISSYVKAGRLKEVPAQMQRFVNDGGVRLQGLVVRRRAEADLWNQSVTAQTGAEPMFAEAPPVKAPVKSRTFRSSMFAGFTAVAGAATAGVQAVSPYAHDGILKYALVLFVSLSAAGGFMAAFFRAGDLQGAAA